MRPKGRKHSVDDELQVGLDNTTESWKRGLLFAAREARQTERWIARIAGLTLIVALATLLVTLVK
jgi:hypothetical protein